MPRSVDTDEKPKRATRKRATSSRARRTAPAAAVSEKSTSRRRAPRKRVPSDESPPAAVKKAVPKKAPTEGRKAPTSIAASKAERKAKRNQLIIVGVLLVIGVGSSAAVGFTDDGQIDVNEAIEARNERIRSGQVDDVQNVVVPVQNTSANQLPDGGLVGLGIGAEPPPPPEPVATTTASSTASSTDEVASSTDSENVEDSEVSESDVEESVDQSSEGSTELEEATEPEPADVADTPEGSEDGG